MVLCGNLKNRDENAPSVFLCVCVAVLPAEEARTTTSAAGWPMPGTSQTPILWVAFTALMPVMFVPRWSVSFLSLRKSPTLLVWFFVELCHIDLKVAMLRSVGWRRGQCDTQIWLLTQWVFHKVVKTGQAGSGLHTTSGIRNKTQIQNHFRFIFIYIKQLFQQ